ncbi:hypothetical protein H5J25_13715 [Sphingomonas aliaeris]|uniref:Uncharacterized protein n=1 Tax=Sphingomonas aliaeris TaxID=2759526 RepID=A0A974NT93_9SPHN|nr:hypothetical protein [Sphingomonas aliaeris]QQV76502.1 hypothetical protein H5J25_13715 [Sphingomonas aliaeris]
MGRTIEVDVDIHDFPDADILSAADRIRGKLGQITGDAEGQDMRELIRAIISGDQREALTVLERAVSESAALVHLVQTARARAL